MVEAPTEMETLLRSQAQANGVSTAKGSPVELKSRSAEFPDATFLVYLPQEEDRLLMLVPKRFAKEVA